MSQVWQLLGADLIFHSLPSDHVSHTIPSSPHVMLHTQPSSLDHPVPQYHLTIFIIIWMGRGEVQTMERNKNIFGNVFGGHCVVPWLMTAPLCTKQRCRWRGWGRPSDRRHRPQHHTDTTHHSRRGATQQGPHLAEASPGLLHPTHTEKLSQETQQGWAMVAQSVAPGHTSPRDLHLTA